MANTDFLDKLKSLGIVGVDWKSFSEKDFENPFIKRFKPLLEQLSVVLEDQIEGKVQEVKNLREIMERSRNGGGS